MNTDIRKRVQDALETSKRGYPIYLAKNYVNQRHFTEGQIDAFQAVLNWLDAPNDQAHRSAPTADGEPEEN